MTCKNHEWVVFSTVLEQGWLMLQCVNCGLHATVDDPSLIATLRELAKG
jgi:hypothetical protein